MLKISKQLLSMSLINQEHLSIFVFVYGKYWNNKSQLKLKNSDVLKKCSFLNYQSSEDKRFISLYKN